MKTGKEKNPHGNIHRQQLFYWMGGSLDRKSGKRKVFSDALVKECLSQLRNSLENGLWVKSPRFPEQFDFKGKHFSLNAPICCFTEWSLGGVCRTLLNTAGSAWDFRSAGSLNTDGQSVTYFRHSEKGSFLQAVFKLIEVLGHHEKDGIWKPRGGVSGFEEFRYLLHFAKMIRLKKVSIHQ